MRPCLVVAIAAIVIPLANAAEKTYTLTVNPTTMCASTADGGASTVVTLRNTGSPQTAGLGRGVLPGGLGRSVSGRGGSCASSSTSSSLERDEGHRRAQQPEHGSGTVEDRHRHVQDDGELLDGGHRRVEAGEQLQRQRRRREPVHGSRQASRRCASSSASRSRAACSRIATSTSRTSSPGTRPSTTKTSPRWAGRFSSSRRRSEPRRIRPRRFKTATTVAEGVYTFTGVPTLADYKICVVASADDDDSKWGLQSPTGNAECGQISNATNAPSTSAGKLLPNLAGPASSMATDFQVVPVVGPFGRGDTSTIGGYKVTAASNPDQKPDQLYVQDTWVDDRGADGLPVLPDPAVRSASRTARRRSSSSRSSPRTSTWTTSRVSRPSWSTTTTPPFLDWRSEADAVLPASIRRAVGRQASSRRPVSCRVRTRRASSPARRTSWQAATSTSCTRSTPRTTAVGGSARTTQRGARRGDRPR